MKCWQRVSTAVSLAVCCAASFAQRSDQARAVEAADQILSAEEFRPADDPGMLAEWLQSIADWLDGLFAAAENPFNGMGSVLAPIFMAIVIAVLLFLLAWIITIVIGRRQQAEKVLSFAEERLAPPHELIRLAEAAAAANDYSRAFTLAYWAFLKLSDAAGHLDYSDDETNWEIISTLRASVPTQISADAKKHASLFDEIEYGSGKAFEADYLAVRELIKTIESVPVAA